eukprot:jgi/Bigna1/72615/fgenesh1_pg.20_\
MPRVEALSIRKSTGASSPPSSSRQKSIRCSSSTRTADESGNPNLLGGIDIFEARNTAIKAAKEAGELIRQRLGADVIEVVTYKLTKLNAMDLLTEVDGKCQEIIEKIILEAYPAHGFLGEEKWLWIVDPIDGTTNFASGMPLVGTIIGLAHKGKMVLGVIYDPFNDELFEAILGNGAFVNGKRMQVSDAASLSRSVVYTGSPPNPRSIAPTLRSVHALMPRARTIRMLGTAALMLAWVAAGRAGAYYEPDLNAWDSILHLDAVFENHQAAGVLMVKEAGGQVTDLEGNDWTLSTRPLCATNGKIHEELLEITRSVECTGLDPE